MFISVPALIVLCVGIVMLAAERLIPGRGWPKVKGWFTRAILFNAVQASAVLLTGLTWDAWFPQMRLWNLEYLGVFGGALVGYLVITFIYYWWHRARHEIGFLWRWFHQVHHSPRRIELLTSFYKHPLEIVVNGALSSFILYALLGLSPGAAALAVTATGIAELFYHWNVRTPHWLGFIIQRPESHCIHHQEGWHRNNYSDLPLWDMLFGTFQNPRASEFVCGFDPQREAELPAMLIGRDIHAPRSTT